MEMTVKLASIARKQKAESWPHVSVAPQNLIKLINSGGDSFHLEVVVVVIKKGWRINHQTTKNLLSS